MRERERERERERGRGEMDKRTDKQTERWYSIVVLYTFNQV